MRISVIFTGGTIGSRVSGGYIAPGVKPPYELIENYNKSFPDRKHEFLAREPYRILSENLSGHYLDCLLGAVAEEIKRKPEGIIITHGTDTLQFTAAALDIFFKDTPIPILLVSSQRVLSDLEANGNRNFAAAVSYIEEGKKGGVFVSYENPGEGYARLHEGRKMLLPATFSESMDSTFEAEEEPDLKLPEGFLPDHFKGKAEEFLAGGGFEKREGRVLLFRACPGMAYPFAEGLRSVIIEGYHCGTLKADKTLEDYVKRLGEREISVYVAGLSRKKLQYETVKVYRQLGLIPVFDMTPVEIYMRLWACN